MLTDVEYSLLPDDPSMAFVRFAELAQSRAEERVNTAVDFDSNADVGQIWREFAYSVRGALSAYDVEHSIDTDAPSDPDTFGEWLRQFLAQLEETKTILRISNYRKASPSEDPMVNFSAFEIKGDFRDDIRNHTRKIRKILNQIELEPNLRELLLKRLNSFEQDLDRRRTRIESYIALFLDLSQAAGEGAENLDPVLTQVERIGGLIRKSMGIPSISHDHPRALPSPEEDEELDDEIPF